MTQYARTGVLAPGAARRMLGCAATVWVLSGAATASAAIDPAGPGVRPGKNVTVFHNIDFIAASGHRVGEDVQVDIVRGGHRIATARGAAADTPEGGALEVNHGPAGVPLPGDCWEGATPDVRPGDLIRVTSAGGVDEVIVDDISIDSVTRMAPGGTPLPADAEGSDQDEIWVQGHARSGLDGSSIVALLDSGEFRDPFNGQLRLEPNTIGPGLEDGTYVAKYYNRSRDPLRWTKDQASVSATLAALERDGHAIGFGHVDPLPAHGMLVEGTGLANGPAPGCEVSPARPSSVGTVSEDELVVANTAGLADGDTALTVGGWADVAVEAADVEVRDESGNTVVKPVAGLAAGATAQQGWGTTLTKGELAGLEQGELSVRLLVGGAPAGVEKTVVHDTVAPVISVTPEPGSYERSQRVEVTGDEPVTYKLDGGPTRGYDEPIAIGTGVTRSSCAPRTRPAT
jgi:hypothetical protein